MQQTNRKKPDSGVLNGIKIVLASGAVAGAVGIWSMLAGNAMNDVNLQSQDQGNTGLADLPTLIPLADVQASVINPVTDPSTTGLRSVTIPTQSSTLQSPVVQPMVLGAPAVGAVSGGVVKPKRPAARTRSSRKR
jgi:hypothetical protein